MKIVWVPSGGNYPFQTWQMSTDHTPVPRVGDFVSEGDHPYLVTKVLWAYSHDTVFIYVDSKR